MTTRQTDAAQAQADEEAARLAAEAAQAQAEAHRDMCVAQTEAAQGELAASVAETGAVKQADDARILQLEKNLSTMTAAKAGRDKDVTTWEGKGAKLDGQLKDAAAKVKAKEAERRELDSWKRDALDREVAAQGKLEDTMAQLAANIEVARAEQAAAQAAMEVAQKELREAATGLEAVKGDTADAQAARAKALQELKAEVAAGAAKTQQIGQLQKDLESAKRAEAAAAEEAAGARSQAAAQSAEAGSMKARFDAASQNEQNVLAQLAETERKLQALEELSLSNDAVMGQQLDAFTAAQAANKELSAACNKLSSMADTAEAEAAAAKHAGTGSAEAELIMPELRTQMGLLQKALKGAAGTFDAKLGVFVPGDLRADLKKGAVGRGMPSVTPAGKPSGVKVPPQIRCAHLDQPTNSPNASAA
jgi:hypothetical protein